MSESVIYAQGLVKSFGDQLVWKDISFDIKEGQVLAVIGRSGSGKSVLIKHINRLLKPDKGKIYVFSQDISNMDYISIRKLRMSCGMLFQDGALFDSLNVFDNIAFPLRYIERVFDRTQLEERVHMALNLVGLYGVDHKMPSEISGGMKKRVGLARAMILRPRIMLYDEPTSGLDPETAESINNLIVDLNKKFNMASIVITHDINSMLSIADKVLFITNKSVGWYGRAADIMNTNNKQIKSFIKASGVVG